jgi:hypothetical protein
MGNHGESNVKVTMEAAAETVAGWAWILTRQG